MKVEEQSEQEFMRKGEPSNSGHFLFDKDRGTALQPLIRIHKMPALVD